MMFLNVCAFTLNETQYETEEVIMTERNRDETELMFHWTSTSICI